MEASAIPPTSNGTPAHKTHKIALIPGDGIGIEVIHAGQIVLQHLATHLKTFSLQFQEFEWSSAYYRKHGRYLPDDALDQVRKFDAILFGAVGAPDIPDHISLWSLRLALCQPLQQYANVRPTRILRGTTSPLSSCVHTPSSLNWCIIRENSEGEYAGHGGVSHINQPWSVATEVSIFTHHGCSRIMRFAFQTAQSRPRKKLTLITKSNAQRNGMVFWDSVAMKIAAEFPDVTWDKELVDAATCRMVLRPESLDTIVATNLHADILSDLAAALSGSIGVAPTSNLDPTRRNPSMFEPIHGSAFDITGLGVANPVGTFWSCAEMLRWIWEAGAADILMEAVENVTEGGVKTRDLGGTAKTVEVTEAVCKEIERLVARQANK